MQSVSLRDYCKQASSFIGSGDPRQAVPITRHILRHYPRHIEAYRLLGRALLATHHYQEAARQFRRVLSADPEDVASRLGLAEINQVTGDLDKARHHLRRAVELSPGDSDLRAQLGRLDQLHPAGAGPQKPEITRAALGRIHARAGLYDKAAQEFKAVLAQNPKRVDVQIALAEVLWRSGRLLEAAEICHSILDKLPHALKANLILGALWLDNDQPDQAEPYLRLAQELDPENLVAQSFFGEASPLPPLVAPIEPLGEDEIEEFQFTPPPTSPAEPELVSWEPELATDWMSESHEEGSTPMNDEKRDDEGFELPDWLQGVGDDLLEDRDDRPPASGPSEQEPGEDEGTPSWLRELVARTEDVDAPEEATPAEAGDVPDWLQELRPEVLEEAVPGVETPDWLASISQDQLPEDLQPEPVPGSIEPEAPLEPLPPLDLGEEVDLGDLEEAPWPEAIGLEEPKPVAKIPPVEEPELPPVPEAETPFETTGLPDWLKEIQQGETQPEPEAEPGIEEVEPSLLEPLHDVVEESDVPDWLREITAGEPVPAEHVEPVAEPAPEAGVDEVGLPDWLRDFEEPAAEQVAFEALPEGPDLAPEPTATAEEGRALWEQILAEEGLDLGAVEEAPPAEAAGMTAEEWLRSTADLEGAPSIAEVRRPSVEPSVVEEPQAPPLPAEPEAEPPEELPDWMRELREPAAELELPAEPEAGIEPQEAPAVEVDEAGLPDWLREPVAETTEVLEPELSPPAQTPDWLAELETPDMFVAETELEEPVELETGEMPDWLGEMMAVEPSLSEEWPPEPVEAETPEEQVPDWLRDFRERAGEIEAEPAEEVSEFEALVGAEEEAEFPEPAELPDWLLHLREGVPEAGPLPPVEEIPLAPPEEILPEIPVEFEAEPSEAEVIQFEPAVPAPPEEVVAAEEGLAELEIAEEEAVPIAEEIIAPEEVVELPQVEILPEPEPEPLEATEPVEAAVPEPVKAPVPELFVTRKLEALKAEDLPRDPAARLSMARAAFNAGDWPDALMIYETLVNSSEMLDSVIDNLEVGIRRYPDDPAGYQLLGDACMKDGRLPAALGAYRKALSRL